jgi:hypothetical protein
VDEAGLSGVASGCIGQQVPEVHDGGQHKPVL